MGEYIAIAISVTLALVIALLLPRPRLRWTDHARDEFSLPPCTRDISVVFTNLDNTVGLFERIGDAAGAELLNEYFRIMIPIVRRHNGHLRLAFDSMFCLFGAIQDSGNHAQTAIEAVLEMQAAMDSFNQARAQRGQPRLRMRVGIASGPTVVGDIGGPNFYQFTAIGHTVDLAKRLETACKTTGARNLISAETRARTQPFFQFRKIEPLSPAGAANPIEWFEAIQPLRAESSAA